MLSCFFCHFQALHCMNQDHEDFLNLMEPRIVLIQYCFHSCEIVLDIQFILKFHYPKIFSHQKKLSFIAVSSTWKMFEYIFKSQVHYTPICQETDCFPHMAADLTPYSFPRRNPVQQLKNTISFLTFLSAAFRLSPSVWTIKLVHDIKIFV